MGIGLKIAIVLAVLIVLIGVGWLVWSLQQPQTVQSVQTQPVQTVQSVQTVQTGPNASAQAVANAAPQSAVTPPVFQRDANTNYVWRQLTLGATGAIDAPLSADGNDYYLGPATSQDQCQALCANKPLSQCRGYTWVDQTGGDFANQCYGLKTIQNKVAQSNTQSATRESFWPKLGHIMGSEHAGSSKTDHFGTNPGVGTFLQGYARPTALPTTIPPFDPGM